MGDAPKMFAQLSSSPRSFAACAARRRKKNRAAKQYEFEKKKIACSQEKKFLLLFLQRKFSKHHLDARSSASRTKMSNSKEGVSCWFGPDLRNQSMQQLLAES
jgi:hypothetical protein